MTYLHPVAAVPNALINDTTIQYTTKRVAFVLLLLAGRKNRSVTATFATLAKLAKCSTTTAQRAVAELVTRGYLLKSRRYHFGEKQNHLIYASNSYLWFRRDGGYTLISRDILAYDLTPAAFANLLYIYRCAGRKGRAFPSLKRIAGVGLDMAKSTVCLALKALRVLQAVVRHHCVTSRRCFASNSYYTTDHVVSRTEQLPSNGGSPKFDKPNIINQLTEDFTLREDKYGVAQFGRLHNFGDGFGENRFFVYDGVGVKVSLCDEQELVV